MAQPSQSTMLNERPSAGSMAPAAGGSTALAGAGSIGNYKGVMLCNRPFAGVATAAKGGGEGGGAAAGKHAFVTGKVKSEVGFAGKSFHTEKLLRKRVKHETALTRHRKWLADLQLTKQALEEQYMEDIRKKEESKKRFARREARMRQVARENGVSAKINGSGADDENVGSAWSTGMDEKEDPEGATASRCHLSSSENIEHKRQARERKEGCMRSSQEEREQDSCLINAAELRAVEKRRKRDGKPCRPMWAMTEAKAEVEDELKQEEEVEELLEFTRSLDFGRYIKDAEVQSMIDQVKKRISELEKDRAAEEEGLDNDDDGSSDRDREQDSEPLDEAETLLQAKIMKLTNKNLEAFEGDSRVNAADNRHDDDNISIARTALSEGGRSVRSIHSTRSLAAVVERARVGIMTARGAGDGSGTTRTRTDNSCSVMSREGSEMPVNDIMVVTHQDDGGLRLGGKNTVSNLPYIRRNPAI